MKYAIGIDLHGTLLDDDWAIKPEFHEALVGALEAVSTFSRVYICTGNDLTFIDHYIPSDVRNCLSGFILETGCVMSDGESETVIVPRQKIARIRALEGLLKKKRFPGIQYFARRLSTISMFTRTESGGFDPARLKPEVEREVARLGFGEEVHVTHSNVAVDIIPTGFNKFTGIHHVASGLKTIGVADSLNDIHLLTDSDFAFIPANSSSVLIHSLETSGRQILPLSDWKANADGFVWRSHYPATEGVIDILKFLALDFH